MPKKLGLDDIDRKIMEILQINASISNRDLAKKIELSPPATLVRTKNLAKDNYITEPNYNLNFKKLGFNYCCVIITQTLKKHQEDFIDVLKNTPAILHSTEIKRESEVKYIKDKPDGYTAINFISHCAYKTQEDMIENWSDIVARYGDDISFQVYEAERRIGSKVPVDLSK